MSKDFNSIKPYTYLIIRKKDNLKYHGVRWDNVSKKRSPLKDFAKYYFLVVFFQKNLNQTLQTSDTN